MNEEAQKFLLGLIEPDVWDRAVWRGCAFFFAEGQPPWMAFMFDREEGGREIFAGLRALVGSDDEESLLRICIIEGRYVGNDNAYAASVGPHYKNVLRHFGLSEEEISSERFFTLSRIHRMNPRSLEPLNLFKRLFAQFGVFRLMPAVVTGNSCYPIDELGILKHDLVLRKQSEVRPEGDIDALALKENSPRKD
jgi:hypothetical protein